MEVESSDEEDVGQPAALAVNFSADDNFDLDIPPTTGNEYLRRVRQEYMDCPKVVVSSIDTSTFISKQTINNQGPSGCHPAPRGFSPSLQWQKQQVTNFAENRQKLARYKASVKKNKSTTKPKLPLPNDVEGWCRLCFGCLKPPPRNDGDNNLSCTDGSEPDPPKDNLSRLQSSSSSIGPPQGGTLPYTSIVTAMDQHMVIQVLQYHINWFEATGFSTQQGYWLYALLACLQKPLEPDACSLLRSLARACACLRATLDNPEHPFVVPLNLFICLVARYFDQTDLADQES